MSTLRHCRRRSRVAAAEPARAHTSLNSTLRSPLCFVLEWRESSSYDVVYGRFILSHLPDCQRVLATLRDALQPGRVVVLEDIDFFGAGGYRKPRGVHERSAIAHRAAANISGAGYSGMKPLWLFAVLAMSAVLQTGCAPTASVQRREVQLRVRFALTDLDYRPIAGAPVRVVFGSDPDWQRRSSGHRFTTDAKGEHRFATRVSLDTQRRKIPTNFVGSLLSGPQLTDHLLIGAELEYATFSWLYTVDVFRFPDGADVLLDGEAIYTR